MGEHRRSPTGRIHVLRDEVARKIAAGEVVERPHSVVRELLDNALDAGAGEIQVHLSRGGTQQIRVVDDGAGMGIDDLDLCWLPHATSKIETEADLSTTRSLGFRGEALSSIAAVARLEIVSNPADGGPAGRLVVHGGNRIAIEPWRGPKGTSVDVGEIFYSLPARRKFLRTAGAESAMCRLVIIDRALAFPETGFRYFTEGSLRAFFPAARSVGGAASPERETTRMVAGADGGLTDADKGPSPEGLKRRILQVFPDIVEQAFLRTISGSGPGFSFDAVLETPDLFRTDRKFIQIFVNRRRIWDFAFVQAIEYAFAGYLPGGRYPIAFLFLNVDPQLVDFNIHPAKREARFRNAAEIHHRIVEVVRSFLSAHAKRIASSGFQTGDGLLDGFAAGRPIKIGMNEQTAIAAQPRPSLTPSIADRSSVDYDLKNRLDPGEKSPVRYLGQIMGLFLVAEMGERLLIVDQHAAHERLLFDQFMAGGPVQSLLVPLEVTLEPDQSRMLAKNRELLERQGITVEPVDPAVPTDEPTEDSSPVWRVSAVPASLSGSLKRLVDGLQGLEVAGGGIVRQLYATMACRAAVMDGDPVDAVTAVTLIENSLRLENPRCPHGRPIWHEITRSRLFELVGRVV